MCNEHEAQCTFDIGVIIIDLGCKQMVTLQADYKIVHPQSSASPSIISNDMLHISVNLSPGVTVR